MCSSRWVFWLGLVWLVVCGTTVEAVPVRLVNCTTNQTLWASNDLGRVLVPPGVSVGWAATDGFTFGAGGVSASYSVGSGGEYSVILGESGAYVVDDSGWSTGLFWAGLTLGFVFEFGGLGVGWFRRTVAGGGYNE